MRRQRGTREPATSQNVSCRHESPAWITCQPHAPLNSINLCALCLSAPLRESKTTTRETTDGKRKPLQGGGGSGGGGSGRGEGHLRRGTSRRGAERQRAQREKSRRRWGTREPATFQDVSCRHGPPAWIACQLRQGESCRSTQSISALSASLHLCVSQKRQRARFDESSSHSTP